MTGNERQKEKMDDGEGGSKESKRAEMKEK